LAQLSAMRSLIAALIFSAIFSGCVNEFDPNLPDAPVRLVVEGGITNQDGPYTVKLSQTEQLDFLFDGELFQSAQNAVVVITDDLGNQETLTEVSPGFYSTSNSGTGIRGEVGRQYQLTIQTANGKFYVSTLDEMLPVPQLESITTHFEFREGIIGSPLKPNSIFNFVFNVSTEDSTNYNPDIGALIGQPEYNGVGGFLIGNETTLSNISSITETNIGLRLGIITNDPVDQRNYYRWQVRGTFDVFTQPERHVVLGEVSNPNSSLPIRNFYWVPKECCARCWIDFDLGSLFISDDRLKNGQRFFQETALLPLTSFIFQNLGLFEIKQSSLNFEAYQFYQGIQKQIDEVGSIFDTSPTLSISNISNPEDPEDLVLGYFVVSAVSVKTKWVSRRDLPIQIEGFIYSDDCRKISSSIMNSSTNRPPFWPD